MYKVANTHFMNEQPIQASPARLEDWLPVMEQSTKEVFGQMVNSELALASDAPTELLNVTAMVGLAGMLTGAMSVRCEEKAGTLIASRMLGVDLADASANMRDAIGEVCNMVAGNFKYKIPGLGDGCLLSPPTVVTGRDYSVHAKPETPRLHLYMLLENMPFCSLALRSWPERGQKVEVNVRAFFGDLGDLCV
jgi:chemotaxis protein CheX